MLLHLGPAGLGAPLDGTLGSGELDPRAVSALLAESPSADAAPPSAWRFLQ
jgi:hypothetical protein